MENIIRCKWCNLKNPKYIKYHDEEWGRLNLDEKYLFEMLILESFQAGLSWECVLNKREDFEAAYDDFDIDKICDYDDSKIEQLASNSKIIRNKLKIKASINNSRVFKKIQNEYGSFGTYLNTFTKGNIVYENDKTFSELSDSISDDLQKRGMKFVGTTIIYSYLQAIGVIHSHQNECFIYEIEKAAQIIQNGGIVVFPTETVYGIGGNAFNENAINKIYNIKERTYKKPISVLVNNVKMIESVACDISDEEYTIINKFMPGPLTLILKKKENIPNILTSNTDTIGVRIPANELTLKLIEETGVPIATSSANISGDKSNTEIDEIIKNFGDKVDYYIDGGRTSIGIASTVVQIVNRKPIILREGSISIEEIEETLNCRNK